VIKTAFVGFEHPHMTSLYNEIKANSMFEISGAFEADNETRKNAEEKGVEFSKYKSYEEFLNETDSDVVAVGAHYAARGSIIIDALKAGKHVIADKPLCTKAEELEEIRRLANENNSAVCVLLSLRKNSSILGALAAVKNGILGEVNNIVFEGEHPLNYGKRAGWYFEKGKHGGVINDIAVHGIDLVRMFTNSDVDEVIGAREWNFYAREVPDFLDSAQFMLKMKNGAGIIADVSYSAPNEHGYTHPSYWRFSIFGEKGMINLKNGCEDITFYPSQGEIVKIAPVETEMDLITEFAEVIKNEDSIYGYTKEMLDSTEQTLMIQKFADESKH